MAGPEALADRKQAQDILVKAAAPRRLAEEAILESSSQGELILDVFAGRGNTVLAAEAAGRCARAVELSGLNVDSTIRQWQELTGQEARLERTGQTFAEVRRERVSEMNDLNPLGDPILGELMRAELIADRGGVAP